MPDILGIPWGPGTHRPHYDYDAVRTYCGECYEQWPCTTTRTKVLALMADERDRDDRDPQPAGG